jgi:hypothetical protein
LYSFLYEYFKQFKELFKIHKKSLANRPATVDSQGATQRPRLAANKPNVQAQILLEPIPNRSKCRELDVLASSSSGLSCRSTDREIANAESLNTP